MHGSVMLRWLPVKQRSTTMCSCGVTAARYYRSGRTPPDSRCRAHGATPAADTPFIPDGTPGSSGRESARRDGAHTDRCSARATSPSSASLPAVKRQSRVLRARGDRRRRAEPGGCRPVQTRSTSRQRRLLPRREARAGQSSSISEVVKCAFGVEKRLLANHRHRAAAPAGGASLDAVLRDLCPVASVDYIPAAKRNHTSRLASNVRSRPRSGVVPEVVIVVSAQSPVFVVVVTPSTELTDTLHKLLVAHPALFVVVVTPFTELDRNTARG